MDYVDLEQSHRLAKHFYSEQLDNESTLRVETLICPGRKTSPASLIQMFQRYPMVDDLLNAIENRSCPDVTNLMQRDDSCDHVSDEEDHPILTVAEQKRKLAQQRKKRQTQQRKYRINRQITRLRCEMKRVEKTTSNDFIQKQKNRLTDLEKRLASNQQRLEKVKNQQKIAAEKAKSKSKSKSKSDKTKAKVEKCASNEE